MISNVFEINMLIDFYGKLLSEKQLKALEMYYIYDCSLNEIGDELSISKQAVSNNIKRAEQNLRFFESNLKLLQKFEEKKINSKDLKELFKDLENEIGKNNTLKKIETIVFNNEEVY